MCSTHSTVSICGRCMGLEHASALHPYCPLGYAPLNPRNPSGGILLGQTDRCDGDPSPHFMAMVQHAAGPALDLTDVVRMLSHDTLAVLWGHMDRSTKQAFKGTCKMFRDLTYDSLTSAIKLGSRSATAPPRPDLSRREGGYIVYGAEPEGRTVDAAAACTLLHKHRRVENLVYMFGRSIRAGALLIASWHSWHSWRAWHTSQTCA